MKRDNTPLGVLGVFPRPSVRAMHCQHCGRPLSDTAGQSASDACGPLCLVTARAARTSAAIDAAQRLLVRWAEAPLDGRQALAEVSTTETDEISPVPSPLVTVAAEPIVNDLEPIVGQSDPAPQSTARWGIGLALGGLVATAVGGAALVWVRPRLELNAISLAALTAALAGQIALLSGIGVLIRSGRESSGHGKESSNTHAETRQHSLAADPPPAERLSA